MRRQPLLLLLAVTAMLFTACGASFERRLEYATMASGAMQRKMAYAVYTPPGWTTEERLPLVLFLHGGGDSEDCFDRFAIGQILDAAITTGDAPRVVICVPNGERGFWENWHDGTYRYRDWVLQDLLPEVQRSHNTLTGREHLHLMGISMGGHGTLRCALFEPESFASAAAISAPIMNAEQLVEFVSGFWLRLFIPVERIWGPTSDTDRVNREDLFQQWLGPEDLQGLRLMLVHGSDDREGIIKGNRHFHRHLTERGIEHAFLEYEGRHKWVDWRPIFPDVLRFLTRQ